MSSLAKGPAQIVRMSKQAARRAAGPEPRLDVDEVSAVTPDGAQGEADVPERRQEQPPSKPAECHEVVCDRVLLGAAGELGLSGWALSSAGIEHVRVVVDGVPVGL